MKQLMTIVALAVTLISASIFAASAAAMKFSIYILTVFVTFAGFEKPTKAQDGPMVRLLRCWGRRWQELRVMKFNLNNE